MKAFVAERCIRKESSDVLGVRETADEAMASAERQTSREDWECAGEVFLLVSEWDGDQLLAYWRKDNREGAWVHQDLRKRGAA